MKNSTRIKGRRRTIRRSPRQPEDNTLLVGFDLGTNTSCVKASAQGSSELTTSTIVPTVVGYTDKGIVSGVITNNASVLFGDDALQHKLHLRLAAPLKNGTVADLQATRDFSTHIGSLVDSKGKKEIKAVIGIPADADSEARERLRGAVKGVFSKILLMPEPFLAALGYRDENRLRRSNYTDPANNSLFVDIGASTTDLCMIQGYFPTAEDQISLHYAGDTVDETLADSIRRTYPETDLSMLKVRQIKEAYSYAGQEKKSINVRVILGGKPRKLQMGDLIGDACNALVENIFDGLQVLIARASSDSVEEMLQNIILTGGGSRIRNISGELERMLVEEGYESPRVTTVGPNYKESVSIGALKAAQGARDDQWQILLS